MEILELERRGMLVINSRKLVQRAIRRKTDNYQQKIELKESLRVVETEKIKVELQKSEISEQLTMPIAEAKTREFYVTSGDFSAITYIRQREPH
jgi:hypothetical protein